MYAVSWNSAPQEISKWVRLFVLAVLLVGTLQVSQCGGGDDEPTGSYDQSLHTAKGRYGDN